ncbi:MAG: redoxin domain-containing protein [Anaerolineae bacterium]
MPGWIQFHVVSDEEEEPEAEQARPESDATLEIYDEFWAGPGLRANTTEEDVEGSTEELDERHGGEIRPVSLEGLHPEDPPETPPDGSTGSPRRLVEGPIEGIDEGPVEETIVVSGRHIILATAAGLLMLVLAGAIWFYGHGRTQAATAPVARLSDIAVAQDSNSSTSASQPSSGLTAAEVTRLKGGQPSSETARRLTSDKPVAIVNSEPITESQLEREVGIGRVLYPLLQGVPVGDDPQTLERMRTDLLSSLIDERLLVQAAGDAGLTLEDTALDTRLAGLLSRMGLAEADLADMLASVGVTMDDLRASLRSTMLAEKFVADSPAPAGVSGKSAYERWARALQQEANIEIVMEEAKGRTVKLNQPAPGFTLRTPDDDTISLSDFAGQPVLINFWATWCPPCRYEMPFLQAAYDKYKDQSFVVLAVDIQETAEVVKPFLQELGLTFPVAMDRSGAVSSAYRIQAIPTSIFVDRQGVVVDIHRGALTPEVLQGYLDKLITP